MAFADFGEGGAGGTFYVGDFGGGALRVEGDEASGELGFEDDDRERVAEDVVEVAGYALAFGYGGERLIFCLSHEQPGCRALLLADEHVAGADDPDQGDGDDDVDPVNMRDKDHQADGDRCPRHGPKDDPNIVDDEGKEGRGESEKAGGASVEGQHDEAEDRHRDDEAELPGAAARLHVADVESEKDQVDEDVLEPVERPVTNEGLDEEEDGVGEPDVIAGA